MAEDFQRHKQYTYEANASLVLDADRTNRRGKGEATGEVESLHGTLSTFRMGDRITSSSSSQPEGAKRDADKDKDKDSKKKGRSEEAYAGQAKRKRSNSHTAAGILDLDSVNYRPQTADTRAAYEDILTRVQAHLGDQPNDVLRSAADEVISILKDDALREPDKHKEVSAMLTRVSADSFARLMSLAKRLVDFNVRDEAPEGGGRAMDEDVGVAVVFDDEDEESQSEEEEEEDDGVDESKVGSEGLRRGNADAEAGDSSAAHGKLPARDLDAHWLQRQVSAFYSDANESSRLAAQILPMLQLDSRACENQLVALLDYDKFDFVKLLMQNKTRIYLCTRLKQAQSEAERRAIEAEMLGDSEGEGAAILQELYSKSSAENWTADRIGMFTDKARKEAKALKEGYVDRGALGMGKDDDDIVGAGGLAQYASSAAAAPEKVLNLEALQFEAGSRLMTNTSVELPDKSWRAQKKGYEEVHVPAIKPIVPPGEKLVEVSELPAWAQEAFPGIKTLNRIQSKMVQAAFYGTENLLLCAPTGAGKTNVALLCMLNQLSQHMREDGSFDLNAFKIVYVAPMKALVQENVLSFGKKLAPYGVTVRELSGDQNLTSAQVAETQVIVTTPEKWDIITRKAGDRTYTQLVRLIIIDEIHLLHDERGPVLESLVARVLRQIETTQEMVRLVGLSATLPNFEDVSTFLRVNPEKGLFFFDSSYRPVPLQQQYIGITEKKALKRFQLMNEICYEKVLQQAGTNQVLIFVHSRAETVKTAKALRDLALEHGTLNRFVPEGGASEEILKEESELAKNSDLKDLLQHGFGVHHAGLVRADRTLVEDLFSDKHLQVLVSTATLAWGVNLPCHTVILKGTQMYNPELGQWCELSPLDVMQMLGRAGRYGLDSEGEGIIMTQHSELQFYLSLLNQQLPIESQFIKRLPDMLNAEVVLGTVLSVKEAATWLGYTYLFVRMLRSPAVYGVTAEELARDPTLMQTRLNLAHTAATILEKSALIKYDRKSGIMQGTTLGRVASHYYVSHESMRVFTEYLKPSMSDIEVFRLFSLSGEFKNIIVRDEEKLELAKLVTRVPIPIKEGVDEPAAKVNALLQSYISRLKLEGFALVSDMTYIQQSASRLMRAIFEIALKRGWAALAVKTLTICQMIERRTWLSQSPLRQFGAIPEVLIRKLEKSGDIPWERYYDLKAQDLGEMVKIPKMGKTLHKYVHMFPRCELNAQVLPITRSLLKVHLTITPDFQFEQSVHDGAVMFHVIVEDGDGENVLYHETLTLTAKHAAQEQHVDFAVTMQDPQPPQYFIRLVADRWLHSETILPVSFKHLLLPQKFPPPTELLDLQPLPITVLPASMRPLFAKKFQFFNAVQTQTFSALYGSDHSVLVCSPTGSGKTTCAELALLRQFQTDPGAKCVYLCPKDEMLDALHAQLTQRLGALLQVNVSRLTGETAADLKAIEQGSIIVSTPAHWDMVSRRWKQRKNVQNISLYIADELHLLGDRRGAVLEIVLSRARYIASQLERPVRIVGLSVPLANAKDVGDWIGATSSNIFAFPPDVRPVPLEIKMHGFDTNNAASRILAMSKHCYNALARLPAQKPSIVFVPSRKQAQLSTIDFITFAAASGSPQRFLNARAADVALVLESVKEAALRQGLAAGVGYLHSGLLKSDRQIVEGLYRDGALNVLVVPYDLCWSLPAPCYCAVILDTVHYDGKTRAFTDYSIHDVLQMVGAASRPAQDESALCLLLCHTPKKELLKRQLHEPLPVESHLDQDLHDHVCAEVVSKTIENKQDAIDYLTWTFYYRRLVKNPNYYNLQGTSNAQLSDHLSEVIEQTVTDLEESKCLAVEDDMDLQPLNLAMIASYYYIHYTTVELFVSSVTEKTKIRGALEILAASSEFGMLPLRQAEESQLKQLALYLPQGLPPTTSYEDTATKVLVLLQCHFSRLALPAELRGDLHAVLQDGIKLLQAFVDVVASQGWLKPAVAAMELSQMLVQGLWDKDSVLLQIPHFTNDTVAAMKAAKVETVFEVLEMDDALREQVLPLPAAQMSDVALFCNAYPNIEMSFELDAEEGGIVAAGAAVTVNIALQREVDEDDEEDAASIGAVRSSRFPHAKSESWWLLVGDKRRNALLCIKRVTLQAALRAKLQFTAPEALGAHELTLYFMSDSYLGCDQEYDLSITCVAGEEDEDEMQE